MYLFAWPTPPVPDVLEYQRMLAADLARKAEMMHRESVAFIPLARRLIEVGTAQGRDMSWGYTEWCGLYVRAQLGIREGFDAVFDLHEMVAEEVARLSMISASYNPTTTDPEPNVDADLKRKVFTFKAGHARFSLMVIAHYASEVCHRVEIGTQPKYELRCDGSVPPSAAPTPAANLDNVDIPF